MLSIPTCHSFNYWWHAKQAVVQCGDPELCIVVLRCVTGFPTTSGSRVCAPPGMNIMGGG